MWKRNGLSSKTWSNVLLSPCPSVCVLQLFHQPCHQSLSVCVLDSVGWVTFTGVGPIFIWHRMLFLYIFLAFSPHGLLLLSVDPVLFSGASMVLRPLLTDHVKLAPHPLFSDRQRILEWEVFCVFMEVNQYRDVCTIEPTAEYILMWLFSLQIFPGFSLAELIPFWMLWIGTESLTCTELIFDHQAQHRFNCSPFSLLPAAQTPWNRPWCPPTHTHRPPRSPAPQQTLPRPLHSSFANVGGGGTYLKMKKRPKRWIPVFRSLQPFGRLNSSRQVEIPWETPSCPSAKP